MAINVVCPGCLKRFKVSDRFAGMKGPCPNCNSIIEIPKASVKIHGAEEFERGGRSATGKLILKPISRLDMDFNPGYAGLVSVAVLAVFIIALVFGSMSLSTGTLDMIGVVGLLLIAFPMSLFGYQMLRDREQLFMLTGSELYRKTALCGLVYAVLWIMFESVSAYMNANEYFIWIYFAAFACIGMLATHGILDINIGNALLHFLIFAFPVIILRWALSFGWLWNVVEKASGGAIPPPVLPGM